MGYKIKPFTMRVRNNSTQEFEDVGLLGSDVDAEINDLRSDIANVSNKVIHKNILLISDSYGADDSAGGTSWETIVANRLTDRNVDKYYWGGHAFGDPTYSLPDKIATIPASDSVDYILILCGANDGNRLYAEDITTTDIGDGISAAVTTMRTNFPNAEIHIGFVGRYRNAAKFNAYRNARNAYKDRCLSIGVTFADNFEYILHDRNLLNSTDLVHPTAEGSALIGNYAIQYILNGSINVTYRGLLNVPIGSTSIYLDVKVKNAMTLVTIRGSDMGAIVTLPRSSIPASSGWIASAFTLNSAQYIINIAGDRNGVVMGYGSLSSSTDGYDTAFTATLSDTELDIFNRRAPGSAALTAIPTVYVMFSPIVCDSMIC